MCPVCSLNLLSLFDLYSRNWILTSYNSEKQVFLPEKKQVKILVLLFYFSGNLREIN